MLNFKSLFTQKKQPKQAIEIDLSIKDKATNNHNFFDSKDCNIHVIDLFNYTNMNAIDYNFLSISQAIANNLNK